MCTPEIVQSFKPDSLKGKNPYDPDEHHMNDMNVQIS